MALRRLYRDKSSYPLILMIYGFSLRNQPSIASI